MKTMQGQIIAVTDQLILLALDQTFKTGDIVEVEEDPDDRYLQIRKPGKIARFSIYKELRCCLRENNKRYGKDNRNNSSHIYAQRKI